MNFGRHHTNDRSTERISINTGYMPVLASLIAIKYSPPIQPLASFEPSPPFHSTDPEAQRRGRAGRSLPHRRPAYTIGYPQYFTPTLYKIIFFNAPLKRSPAGYGPCESIRLHANNPHPAKKDLFIRNPCLWPSLRSCRHPGKMFS